PTAGHCQSQWGQSCCGGFGKEDSVLGRLGAVEHCEQPSEAATGLCEMSELLKGKDQRSHGFQASVELTLTEKFLCAGERLQFDNPASQDCNMCIPSYLKHEITELELSLYPKMSSSAIHPQEANLTAKLMKKKKVKEEKEEEERKRRIRRRRGRRREEEEGEGGGGKEEEEEGGGGGGDDDL
ncbi:hypothetical protein STEG23_014534, partial [Scotinomys teguina]